MKFVLIYVKFVEEDVFYNPDMMEIVIVIQIIGVISYVMFQIVEINNIYVTKIMVIVIFITVKNLIIYVERYVPMKLVKIVVN